MNKKQLKEINRLHDENKNLKSSLLINDKSFENNKLLQKVYNNLKNESESNAKNQANAISQLQDEYDKLKNQ